MGLFGRRTPQVDKLQRGGKLALMLEASRYSDRLVDRTGKVLDRGAPVRADAVRALAAYEPAEGEDVPALVPLYAERLEDESGEVVRAAATALGHDGSRKAAWALVDLLAARGPALAPATRQSVLDAISACECAGISEHWCLRVVETRGSDLADSDRENLAALMDADASADPRAHVVEVLAPAVASDDDGQAALAEAILAQCLPGAVPGMEHMLTRQEVSARAIRLAGRSGDQGLLEPLIRLLEHPAATTRAQAATALGDLSDTAAVLALMGATSDPDVHVRKSAIAALDALGSAGVTAAVATLAHSASQGTEPAPPALGGRTWKRTLARLTERSGLADRTRRLLAPDDGAERYAGMLEARSRYESLVDQPERPPDTG